MPEIAAEMMEVEYDLDAGWWSPHGANTLELGNAFPSMRALPDSSR